MAVQAFEKHQAADNPQFAEVIPVGKYGPVKAIGRAGVHSFEALQEGRTPLPEGYYYENPYQVQPEEVIRLARQVEVGKDTKDNFIEWRYYEAKVRRAQILDVTVRSNEGELVGFASLLYRENQGELADFVVSPKHQHRGLGKALIAERLRMAEQAGIDSLYIPPIEPTNTLRSYYLENGFHETEAGELVQGPDPRPILR